MKLVTIGDSITKGTFTNDGEPMPISIANPNFSDVLKEKLGADILENYGVNGIAFCPINGEDGKFSICDTCLNFKDADIVVIAAGTNDFLGRYEKGNPLGSINDNTINTFYGAMSFVFSTIIKNNPKSKNFAVLPIKRKEEKMINSEGLYLDDYRKAMTISATKHGINVIDGSKLDIDPEREQDVKKYILDGLHPNVAGHIKYGEFLYSYVKRLI